MAIHNLQLKLKFLIFMSCSTTVTFYAFGITILPLNWLLLYVSQRKTNIKHSI